MKLKNLNRMKTVFTIAIIAFASLAIGSVLGNMATDPLHPEMANVNVALCTTVLCGAQLALKYGTLPTGLPFVRTAGIDQEMWADRIVEPLFADDSILSKVLRIDDEFILGGSVVHVPQSGANANVVKNRTVFPAVAVRRTDTDMFYPLDVFSSDPVHITDAEARQVSYKKMDSVLKLMPLNIRNNITNDLLYRWAGVGAPQIMRTTGALFAGNLAPGATGTRRVLQYADFVAAMTRMDEQDVPNEGRFALLDAIQYGELLKDPEVTKMSIEKLADRAKGVVAELSGFKIMKRSRNTVYDGAGTPVAKAPGAATGVTDNRSALLFQSDSLNCALGTTNFFETIGSAVYFGDVYSAEIKAGGRQERGDGFGVISLVQAAS